MQANLHRRPAANSNRGFTLVEMLVVLAIIGILMAILVPVIGGVIRNANEFAIKADIKNINTAIEGYKTKTFAYPVDFRNLAAIKPHVGKLSARADTTSLIDLTDLTIGWYGSTLDNPHFARGTSTIAQRDPNNIDAAEAWVFWLYETTNNARYPLGAVPSGGTYILDPNWATVWDPDKFMEFNPKQLVDKDADGWFEYIAPKGSTIEPYVYFDSRTYTNSNAAVRALAFYPNVDRGVGYAQPYFQKINTATGLPEWYEPNKYQLINCGLDDQFGLLYDINSATSTDWKVVESPQGQNITSADRDNIVSFTTDRLDKSFPD